MNTLRGAYLIISLVLVGVYPWVTASGRNAVFLLASGSAIAALLAALLINPSNRSFWWLMLAGFVVIEIANVLAVLDRGTAISVNGPIDGVGNLLLLTAAFMLVTLQGRNNLGGLVDASIAAVAAGGVFWELVLGPNLLPDYSVGPAQLGLGLVLIALSGVLGALGQLLVTRPIAALRPLIAALVFGLAGTLIVAVTTDQRLTTIAGMMFVAASTAIGLFALDPSASHLFTPAPRRPDTLSPGRLVFLGLAAAIMPIIVGTTLAAGGHSGGGALVITSATISSLVMVRIGQLSAQRNRAEQALRFDATHDALTGLTNRKEFVTHVGQALNRRERCAILFCDLDGFKTVNDNFGHDRGDDVLVQVAERLRECVRADDLIGRFGGDEFVILVRNTTPAEVQAINQRIIAALSRPVAMSDTFVTIGVTTGTAAALNDTKPESLIRRADQAMYAEKIRAR